MPYATLDQLTDRYGLAMLVDLTDRAEVATGEVDAAVVARALADADALIDGHLRDRYALPLAAVPELIGTLAAQIAIWNLHLGEPNAKIAEDYRQALKTLEAIGRGAIRLSVAGVEAAETGGTGARITDRERPLTAENLKGFI